MEFGKDQPGKLDRLIGTVADPQGEDTAATGRIAPANRKPDFLVEEAQAIATPLSSFQFGGWSAGGTELFGELVGWLLCSC